MRWLGAADACWQVLGFDTHQQRPGCHVIRVNTRDRAPVLIPPHVQLNPGALLQVANTNTNFDLFLYFARPPGPLFDNLTILELFSLYTVVKTKEDNWPPRDNRRRQGWFKVPTLRWQVYIVSCMFACSQNTDSNTRFHRL